MRFSCVDFSTQTPMSDNGDQSMVQVCQREKDGTTVMAHGRKYRLGSQEGVAGITLPPDRSASAAAVEVNIILQSIFYGCDASVEPSLVSSSSVCSLDSVHCDDQQDAPNAAHEWGSQLRLPGNPLVVFSQKESMNGIALAASSRHTGKGRQTHNSSKYFSTSTMMPDISAAADEGDNNSDEEIGSLCSQEEFRALFELEGLAKALDKRVESLLVRMPPECSALEGIYNLVDGFRPNDFPLWKHSGGDYWLFSGTQGVLLFGDSEQAASNFECSEGVVASVRSHNGRMPHEVGEWHWEKEQLDDWVVDDRIKILLHKEKNSNNYDEFDSNYSGTGSSSLDCIFSDVHSPSRRVQTLFSLPSAAEFMGTKHRVSRIMTSP